METISESSESSESSKLNNSKISGFINKVKIFIKRFMQKMDPFIFIGSNIITIIILIIYLLWHLKVGGTEWQQDFSQVFVILLYVLTVSVGALKIFSIPKSFTNPKAPVVEEIFSLIISIFATLLEFMVFSLSLVILSIMGDLNIIEFFLKIILENLWFWLFVLLTGVVYFFAHIIYAKFINRIFSFIFNNTLISIIRSIMCLAIWMLIWGWFYKTLASHETWGFWVFWGVSLLFCLLPVIIMGLGSINIAQMVEKLMIRGNKAASRVGGFLQPQEIKTQEAIAKDKAGENLKVEYSLPKIGKLQSLAGHEEFKNKVRERRVFQESYPIYKELYKKNKEFIKPIDKIKKDSIMEAKATIKKADDKHKERIQKLKNKVFKSKPKNQ